MSYFNGHGFTDMQGRWQYAPTTRVFCDDCAETAIPLPPKIEGAHNGQRHRDTGFKWAPHYGGRTKCHECGALV